ncbi:MAG: hypothetical protein VW455_12970 [Nitrospinota bacterium]
MLPKKIKETVFDTVSAITMRKFFNPKDLKNSEGILKKVLSQSQRDFFINGTITSHSASPEHMAGMWMAGREISLVNGHLPAWLKKAMGAGLSEVNKCPYCEDMLLSLTFGANESNLANSLEQNTLSEIKDEKVRKIMGWVKASSTKYSEILKDPPFTEAQMPEALGNLIVFGYTNRISDFTLDGSPVPWMGRNISLRLFGVELKESVQLDLTPGLSLSLLPEGEVPEDLGWSFSNPLVSESLARWNRVLEKNISAVLSPQAINHIKENLQNWEGGPAPVSRAWVEDEVTHIPVAERNKVRVGLLVAKASYQIDDSLIQQLVDEGMSESDLIGLGAWSAFMGSKTVANWCAPYSHSNVENPLLTTAT